MSMRNVGRSFTHGQTSVYFRGLIVRKCLLNTTTVANCSVSGIILLNIWEFILKRNPIIPQVHSLCCSYAGVQLPQVAEPLHHRGWRSSSPRSHLGSSPGRSVLKHGSHKNTSLQLFQSRNEVQSNGGRTPWGSVLSFSLHFCVQRGLVCSCWYKQESWVILHPHYHTLCPWHIMGSKDTWVTKTWVLSRKRTRRLLWETHMKTGAVKQLCCYSRNLSRAPKGIKKSRFKTWVLEERCTGARAV